MNKMLIAFAVSLGLITWNEVSVCHDLPWPPRFVFAGLVFSMLDLVSMIDEDLAGVIAIGFVVALALPAVSSYEAKSSKGNPFVATCNHQSTAPPNTTSELSGGLPTNTVTGGGPVN